MQKPPQENAPEEPIVVGTIGKSWAKLISEIEESGQQKKGSKELKELDPFKKENLLNLASDRKLKQNYAKYFIWILAVQLLVMNAVFILVGCDKLKFDDKRWALEIYLTGTLTEVFAVVAIITKNLFPQEK